MYEDTGFGMAGGEKFPQILHTAPDPNTLFILPWLLL